MEEMNNKYQTVLVNWGKEWEGLIQEVYRLLKDQEKKIFDLSWYEGNTRGIMGYVEDCVKEQLTYIVIDTEANRTAGVFILENPRVYKGEALFANIHCVVSKRYWGKASKEVCTYFKKFLQDNVAIRKLIAYIPQNNYSLIKLLKFIGFRHEGTVKDVVVYLDKNGNEKLYDELIYGLNLGDK